MRTEFKAITDGKFERYIKSRWLTAEAMHAYVEPRQQYEIKYPRSSWNKFVAECNFKHRANGLPDDNVQPCVFHARRKTAWANGTRTTLYI